MPHRSGRRPNSRPTPDSRRIGRLIVSSGEPVASRWLTKRSFHFEVGVSLVDGHDGRYDGRLCGRRKSSMGCGNGSYR